jgi:hypothetical protein
MIGDIPHYHIKRFCQATRFGSISRVHICLYACRTASKAWFGASASPCNVPHALERANVLAMNSMEIQGRPRQRWKCILVTNTPLKERLVTLHMRCHLHLSCHLHIRLDGLHVDRTPVSTERVIRPPGLTARISRFGQTTFRGDIARHVVFPAVSPTPFGLPPYQLSLQVPVSLNVDLRLSRSRLSQGESTRTWHTELVVVLRGRKEVAQTVGCTSLGDINRVRREKRPLSDPLHRSGY